MLVITAYNKLQSGLKAVTADSQGYLFLRIRLKFKLTFPVCVRAFFSMPLPRPLSIIILNKLFSFAIKGIQ